MKPIITSTIQYQFMTKKTFKKILAWTGSFMLLLVVVLCVHIYIVTRPQPANPYIKAMARIDIKQPIDQDDANKITTFLYQEKGIDHVLCNPKGGIVIFSFYPSKTTANQIVADLKSNMPYKGDRVLPTEQQLAGGCPMASTTTYKFYSFIKHVF